MHLGTILTQGYRNIYQRLVRHQQQPPPLIFFLLFAYSHFFRNQHLIANIYVFSILPLTLFFTLHFNATFMSAHFIKLPNIYLSSMIFLVTLAIGCNQKWKFYLLLFNIGNVLAGTHMFRSIFLFLASGLVCYEIYYSLVCRTLKDNRIYFTGFLVIFVYGGINFFCISFEVSINTFAKLVTIVAAGLLGLNLMKWRIRQIMQTNPCRIRDARILAFYLTELQQEIKEDFLKNSRISIHQQTCNNSYCFCKRSSTQNDSSLFLRQLYQNSIKNYQKTNDTLLYEHYITFLLENNLILNALHFLTRWMPTAYFNWISKLRCICEVKDWLSSSDSSNIYQQEYQYALEYDELLLDLASQIYEVLELKLIFWHESARETPKMIKLQVEGSKVVKQMYLLNKYYSEVIKKYEKKLSSFDAAILYATYLLSTTNFKEYAELIIKNTSKMLEEVQILENSTSQTFAVRTSVKKEGQYHMKDSQFDFEHLPIKNSPTSQNKKGNRFKMIIESASNNFYQLVKTKKERLMGSQLTDIIPNIYKQLHKEQIGKILNFDDEIMEEIPQKFHKIITKVGIKLGSNEIIMCLITIKIIININQGYHFISIIKKQKDKTMTALIGLDGAISEKEVGFNQQVLMHCQFKKYFEIVQRRWDQERIIKEERFNLMVNSINLSISISSPFATFFIDADRSHLPPPLHIIISNQSSRKKIAFRSNEQQHKLISNVRQFEMAVNHDSYQSTTNSKNSTSAINILSAFSEKNSVAIYRNIIIGFIIGTSIGLLSNSSTYFLGNLPWDNTNILSNNPLNDTMNFMKLQHLTCNILLNLWDIQQYNSNQNLNKNQISNYFTTKSTYMKSIDNLFKSKFNQFKSYFYDCLQIPSYVLMKELKNRLNTQLIISNLSVIPSKISLQQQNISFQSLLMNYMTDFNLMSKGIYDNSLLLPMTFSATIVNLQNATNFGQIIDNSIDKSLQTLLILQICMTILIGLAIVLFYCFLKGRTLIHQKIFDLFAEIESQMVIKEISSLNYIKNIIKNYREATDILKNNVIDYQQNAIYPKVGSDRKSSINNEIVTGLSKFNGSQMQQQSLEESSEEGRKKTIRKTHGSHIGKMELQIDDKLLLPKRKRAGELDLKGSDSDPSLRIIKKHAILYALFIPSIIFLTLQTSYTRSFGLEIKNRKDSIIKVLDIYTSTELSFFLGKIYFRNGNAGLAAIDPNYGFNYLQSVVGTTPIYDFNGKFGYDSILPNCSKIPATSGSANYSKTVCMLNYTYLTLMAEFGMIFKQLFEARYNADLKYSSYLASNQLNTYNQILANISAKTFYLQSIDNQLQNIVYNMADNIYLDLLAYSQNRTNLIFMLFMGAAYWWGVSIILGTILLLAMKREYFKEVYMLTFLNNDMITNNKRVQSFLDSINKSTL